MERLREILQDICKHIDIENVESFALLRLSIWALELTQLGIFIWSREWFLHTLENQAVENGNSEIQGWLDRHLILLVPTEDKEETRRVEKEWKKHMVSIEASEEQEWFCFWGLPVQHLLAAYAIKERINPEIAVVRGSDTEESNAREELLSWLIDLYLRFPWNEVLHWLVQLLNDADFELVQNLVKTYSPKTKLFEMPASDRHDIILRLEGYRKKHKITDDMRERCKDLIEKISRNAKLRGEYEDLRDTSSDPKERLKSNDEIKNIEQLLYGYRREYHRELDCDRILKNDS